MDFLLISLGLVFIILGIIGSFLPVLPGPITGCIGLLILHQTSIELDGNLFLFVTLVISILVFLIDYIIPALGAKKFGGTKWGMWGSTIGLVIGLLFLGPLGVLIGAFLGVLFVTQLDAEVLKPIISFYLVIIGIIIIKKSLKRKSLCSPWPVDVPANQHSRFCPQWPNRLC